MTALAFTEAVQTAAQYLREARSVVALTGAGLSTPSGIPDFRSAGSGLWTQNDPMKVSSLTAFRQRPERFFNWLRPLAQQILTAAPNAAHAAMAELEQAGRLKAVITQNIDGLHQRAGSQNVIELHGSLRQAHCVHCHQAYSLELYAPAFIDREQIPRCPACGWVLKPDIILFEEALPIKALEEAQTLCESADLILIAGTALEVSPANRLPMFAMENGARMIINTLSATPLDMFADVLMPFDVAQTLPAIAKEVL